ncbi:MAG: hypothetical protein IKD85_04875 [Firmicutes bacterium]|nr:hypothetical protein [Bacillota bacterium]
MQPITVMAVIGIALGIILILFSILCRKKLPGWGMLLFPLIGVMIMISGLLMYLGASALS